MSLSWVYFLPYYLQTISDSLAQGSSLLFAYSSPTKNWICPKFKSDRWDTVNHCPKLINFLTPNFPVSGFSGPPRKPSVVLWFEPHYLWPASAKVALSISFHPQLNWSPGKIYLWKSFLDICLGPGNSSWVQFPDFPNFHCPLEFYMAKLGHISRKSPPKVNFKIVPRLTIILSHLRHGDTYEKCTYVHSTQKCAGPCSNFEEKAKSTWLYKCLVFHAGKDWKRKQVRTSVLEWIWRFSWCAGRCLTYWFSVGNHCIKWMNCPNYSHLFIKDGELWYTMYMKF